MPAYLSTFISGLQAPVERMVRQTLPDAAIERVLDGAVVYATRGDPLSLRCFTNTFALLDSAPNSGANPIESMMRSLVTRKRLPDIPRTPQGKQGTFRVITSEENRLVSVDGQLMALLERHISRAWGVTPHRAKPDIEYWILKRSEGTTYFLMRLTRRASFEKTLQRGQLHPELCSIMNYLSTPTPQDVYLDPFCGSGALPIDRARDKHRFIFAQDISAERVAQLKLEVKHLRADSQRFYVKQCDALALSSKYEPGFFTRIVTDPPWGIFEQIEMPAAEFYGRMLAEFDRVLAPGGRIVLLTSAKQEFEQALAGARLPLALDCRYDILVSGKKAAVYCLAR